MKSRPHKDKLSQRERDNNIQNTADLNLEILCAKYPEIAPWAFHEAAHCAVAILLGRAIKKLSIGHGDVPGSSGMCWYSQGTTGVECLRSELVILMAGAAGQIR